MMRTEDDVELFNRLDPILHILLRSIQELKTYSTELQPTHTMEHQFRLLRLQQQTLHSLDQTLHKLFPRKQSLEDDDFIILDSRRASLAFMGEYVLLPLIHIIKNPFKTTTPTKVKATTTTTTTPKQFTSLEQHSSLAIHWTLQCACIEEASHVLRFFFLQIFQCSHIQLLYWDHHRPTHTDSSSSVKTYSETILQDDNRRVDYYSLDFPQLLQKSIISCVLALQSIVSGGGGGGKTQVTMNHEPSSVDTNQSFLYKGDDCIMAILQCVQTLLQGGSEEDSSVEVGLEPLGYLSQSTYYYNYSHHSFVSSLTREDSSTGLKPRLFPCMMFFLDFTSMWDGGLFILLIESCVSILTADSIKDTATSKHNTGDVGNYYIKYASSSASWIQGNVPLKITCLRILEMLLLFTDQSSRENIHIREKWMLIFPGCFVVRAYILSGFCDLICLWNITWNVSFGYNCLTFVQGIMSGFKDTFTRVQCTDFIKNRLIFFTCTCVAHSYNHDCAP